MATITRIDKRLVQKGTNADLITITGTGFGASQSTGTVTVGGQALTSITWADTEIKGKVAASATTDGSANYGAMDLVITPASGAAVTLDKALMVYDPTNKQDASEVKDTTIAKVYVNGLDCGYTQGGVKSKVNNDTKDIPCDQLRVPLKTLKTSTTGTLSFTMLQPNGTNLAISLGASYDATSKTVTVNANDPLAEYSIAIVKSDGTGRFWPRVQVTDPSELNDQIGNEEQLAFNGRVLANDDGVLCYFVLP